MELASREDLEAQFGDDEATEQAVSKNGKRKIVHGRQPSVQVRGLSAPAVAGAPGYVPGMPHPAQLTGYPSTSGMLPFQSQSQLMSQSAIVDQRSKAPMLVIIVATLVIVLAGIYLYIEIIKGPAPGPKGGDPPTKAQVGKIEIDSTPPGALILVDGKRVPLENGEWARTPIEQLTNLQYGKTYTIRLEKDGYKPVEQQVDMGDAWNGKPLRIVLTAIPGNLIISVAGDSSSSVKVLVNGIEQGYGPGPLRREFEPGPKKVEGVLDGYRCVSDPAAVAVEASRDVTVTLRCDKAVAAPARNYVPSGNGVARNNPGGNAQPPPKNTGSGDCVLLDGVPPGFVTIDTDPYSVIFLGDKKLGETPLAKVKLPSGCMRITAKNAESNISVEKVIRVEPNKTLRYKFELANPASGG
ncbi:MAG: PEGA domain-containing protein [Deltaproteobacteria bacterium]|nr:PEGA domain-containing protein [Deltaproteobacteria bacterium]